MKKYIITTDEQEWLDRFNKWSGLNIKDGEVIEVEIINLVAFVNDFNRTVIGAEAIKISEYEQ